MRLGNRSKFAATVFWHVSALLTAASLATLRAASVSARFQVFGDSVESVELSVGRRDASLDYNLAKPQDYAISNLPGVNASHLDGVNASHLAGQYAGYIPVAANDTAKVFFWYVTTPAASGGSTDLVIWLNGGPGCSSLPGLFQEHGPFLMQDDGSLEANPYSWNGVANILYIDQPVGTGFSFSDTLETTEFTLAKTFLTFLDGWYTTFEETKDYDLFIAGESYASVYISYISKAILDYPYLSDGSPIRLQGIMIGDGLFDQETQLTNKQHYLDQAVFLNESGFFNDDLAALAQAELIAQECYYCTSTNISSIPYNCNLKSYMSAWKANHSDITCVYSYNINEPCDVLTAKTSALTAYLNSTPVQSSLNVLPLPTAVVEVGGWSECSEEVGATLDATVLLEAKAVLPELLDSGLPVLIYEGDLDYVLNYVGLERAIGILT
ncbi:Cell death protease, partial [Cladochytrium tenue]